MLKSHSEVSNYEKTFNKAIDMVTYAVGYNQKFETRVLAALVLKPAAFMLFVKGFEVMNNRELSPEEQQGLTFEGVKILKGSNAQFDFMRVEYVFNAFKKPTAWQA